MPRICLPFLLILGLCADCSAALRAQVSHRDIPLNQELRLSFNTVRPQVEGVDVEATVRNALALQSVREHWRLSQPPQVHQHERAKDLTITIHLLPRHAGELPLPRIPLRWLIGEESIDPGSVQVREEIRVGSETRPLPKELRGVAGYAWGTRLETLRKQVEDEQISVGRPTVIRPQPGLALLVRGDKLTAARIRAESLPLDRARSDFIGRWGVPAVERSSEEGPELVWYIGWLRIVAHSPAPETTVLHLVHEGIEEETISRRVDREVFSLLENEEPGAEAPADEPDAADERDAEDAESAPERSGPSREELEREFETGVVSAALDGVYRLARDTDFRGQCALTQLFTLAVRGYLVVHQFRRTGAWWSSVRLRRRGGATYTPRPHPGRRQGRCRRRSN